MNETETPLIRIEGTITVKDYVDADRSTCARAFLGLCVIILGAMVLAILALGIWEYFSYIRTGVLTVGEALGYTWQAVSQKPMTLVFMAAVIVFWALFFFLLRPALTGKRARELYPNGTPVIYEFYEDRLAVYFQTQTIDQTVRVSYADVLRKIIETRYQFILQTNQKIRIFVFKTVMTPEEAQNVRELLKARCPQRRNPKPKA